MIDTNVGHICVFGFQLINIFGSAHAHITLNMPSWL